jgi:uncharacterized protein
VSGLKVFRIKGDKYVVWDPVSTHWVCCDHAAVELLASCDGNTQVSGLARHATSQSKVADVVGIFAKAGFVSKSRAEPPGRIAPVWPSSVVHHMLAVVQITGTCNLRCPYCYAMASERPKRILPLHIAKKIIDRLLELPCRHFTIQWGGGEALLGFNVMVEATEYANQAAKRLGKAINFCLQTNGTLLTRERAAALKALGIGAGVSIDGPPAATNITRLFANGHGAYDAIASGIANARLEGFQLGCIVTVSPKNVARIEEVVDHVHSLGISDIKLNPCEYLGKARENHDLVITPEHFFHAKKRAVERLLAKSPRTLPSNAQKIAQNLILPVKNLVCYSSPNCGAGVRMLGFDANGDVYPCDQLVGVKPEFKIGNVLEAPIQKMMRTHVNSLFVHRTVSDMKKCRKCSWRHACGGGCAVTAYNISGNVQREGADCAFRKRMFRYMLRKLADDSELREMACGPLMPLPSRLRKGSPKVYSTSEFSRGRIPMTDFWNNTWANWNNWNNWNNWSNWSNWNNNWSKH